MRCKELGAWQEYSWEYCYEQTKYISLAMVSLGVKLGDKVAIMGDGDPEYFWAEYGVMALGGIVVGLHAEARSEEIQYVVEQSHITFAFASGEEQVNKFLSLKKGGGIPSVKGIAYWKIKALWRYEDPILHSFAEMLEIGRRYEKEHSSSFEQNLDKIRPEDIAFCLYTSSTTDLSKGVMMSHQQMLSNAMAIITLDEWHAADNVFSYMSPALVTEQMISGIVPLLSGAVVNFASRPQTIDEDLREVKPNILCCDAKYWESMALSIQSQINDSTPLGRLMFSIARHISDKKVQIEKQGQKLRLLWKIPYVVAFLIVLRPLLSQFGLSNIRIAWITTGSLNVEYFEFLRVIGVPLREMTDICLNLNWDGE